MQIYLDFTIERHPALTPAQELARAQLAYETSPNPTSTRYLNAALAVAHQIERDRRYQTPRIGFGTATNATPNTPEPTDPFEPDSTKPAAIDWLTWSQMDDDRRAFWRDHYAKETPQ